MCLLHIDFKSCIYNRMWKMSTDEVARHLRKPEGEAGIAIGKVMNDGNSRMHAFIFELMKINDHDRILEIGFGNGKFIPEIVKKAKNVSYTGIDISHTMVSEARRFVEQMNIASAEVSLAGVSAIPFTNSSFDKVFTSNTLYFGNTRNRIFGKFTAY